MTTRRSVGIVGMGWVGSSVAMSVLHGGFASEVLLHDKIEGLAEGEALDFRHGSSFYPSADVRSVSLEGMREAAAVVIAAGRGGRPGETRLDLLRENAALARELARGFVGYSGFLIIVTNPVDVLVRIFQEETGLPAERVIGTGTMLDTARLREVVGRELKLDPRSVHAQIVGEHGDSQVPLWSSATAGGRPLRAFPGFDPAREPALAQEVRTAAYEIIRRKGATNHAIGLVTAALLRALLKDERRVLMVSRVQPSDLGLGGVALSLPTVVSAQGAAPVFRPAMEPAEEALLARSAAVLDAAYASAARR